jgi:hypothetical protein
MTTYYIKRGKYYIQETNKEGQFNSVLSKAQATEFSSLDTLESYVTRDMKLNLAKVTVEMETVVTVELKNIKGSWLDTSEIEQCSVCLKWYPVVSLIPSVLDREKGIELLCESCEADADVIISNQPLDELEEL